MAEQDRQPDEPTNDERIKSLEDEAKALRERVESALKRLDDIPSPSDLGYEKPIYRFETDRFFKFQLDQGQLTLMFNKGQAQKEFFGLGGGGSSTGVIFAGYCRITAADPTGIVDARGNPAQWLYTITQVVKGGAGYGNAAWENALDGYVGTARNFCEAGNNGIGRQDNGIDLDGPDFPTGFSMIPIQGTLPFVLMTNEDGEVEAWFDRCNSCDGVCSGSTP